MADTGEIMAALATALEQIPVPRGTLRVQPEMLNNAPVPCAIVGLPTGVDYDMAFTRGPDLYHFSVRVLVGRASERTAQELLASVISGTGDSSVRTAVESDLTLGGVAQSVSVINAQNLGTYQYGEAEYIGVEFTIDVIA